MLRTLTAVLFLLLLPLHTSSAASLVTDANGILTGARDILVGVNKYDVFFGDGSCVGLFSGCDEQSDFPFQPTEADDANRTLIALINSDQRFIYQPSKIAGCADVFSCFMITPRLISSNVLVSTAMVVVRSSVLQPQLNFLEFSPTMDTGTSDNNGRIATYALWKKSLPHTVPEPSTLMLLGIGWLSRRWLRTPGK